MDCTKLSEITVKNQSEMDDIPLDFKGRIYVDCTARVVVSNRYYFRVVARGNSSVVARGNSSVEALENSSVEAWENSSVVARGNSSVEALENSSVEAWGNSSVVASANTQVVDRQLNGKILLSGNARTVYMPKTTHDFMSFYGIKHNKKTATFYKAVKKVDGKYISSRDSNFKYIVGETKTEKCDPNINEGCSYGIHISHLSWALDFAKDWDDLAIIKVETNIDDIVMPTDTNGKVRTCKVNVLREVPLGECGIYGKIIANRKDR